MSVKVKDAGTFSPIFKMLLLAAMSQGYRPAGRLERREGELLERELSVHLSAANNAKKKGEDEAVNDNNVVDLDEQINKVKTMEVDVKVSDPKAELEA